MWFLYVRLRIFRFKVLNIMCSYRWFVEIVIYRYEKCFVKFLGIYCLNIICNDGGYLDKNCECVCFDGLFDC